MRGAPFVAAFAALFSMTLDTAATPATPARSWDDFVEDFAAAYSKLEMACALSLRDAIKPPTGEVPKPLKVELKLARGAIASLRISESSTAADVDEAALAAVRNAALQARCKELDDITITIPFR